jgi:hypothetical protein
VTNFASMLRVTCTLYVRMQGASRRAEKAPEEIRAVVT